MQSRNLQGKELCHNIDCILIGVNTNCYTWLKSVNIQLLKIRHNVSLTHFTNAALLTLGSMDDFEFCCPRGISLHSYSSRFTLNCLNLQIVQASIKIY